MALYSFGRIKVISRGRINKNRSAVAKAAYHAAQKYTNGYDGAIYDFRSKKNVLDTYIRLPENAPEKYTDETVDVRERLGLLWNDVEKFETSKNAQLARANYLALQHDFTMEQNLECVDRFIAENCTSIGMGVTYSVHAKPGNLHVDMMYLMREFDEDGNFKRKTKKEYLCRNASGDERYLDAAAFREAKEKNQDWEKVYKCRRGNSWEQLTNSELKKAEYAGFKKASKYPVDRRVDTNTWNDYHMAEKWRESWAKILNEKFEELGMDERMDHRSYEEQGKDTLPTHHEGYRHRKEKKKKNNDVRSYNQNLQVLKGEAETIIYNAERDLDYLNTILDPKEQLHELNKIETEVVTGDKLIDICRSTDIFESAWRKKLQENWDDVADKTFNKLDNLWEQIDQKRPEVYPDEEKINSLQDKILAARKQTKRREEENELEFRILLKRRIDEESMYNPGWNDSETDIPYKISLYDENGRKRSLIEHMLILAIVVATGEVPDFIRPEWQREASRNKRVALIIVKVDKKVQAFNKALQIARESNIKTPDELRTMLQRNNLPEDERKKLKFLARQVKLASDKEYCYSNPTKTIEKAKNRQR